MTSTEYHLPAMPFGGSEITIVCWLKRAGDRVVAGEPLLVVVNDRVELALPAPSDGLLERTLAVNGAPVAVDASVATIAQLPAPGTAKPLRTLQPDAAVNAGATRATSEHASPERAQRISPLARQIASIAGIDIAKLSGSGISGRIIKADLLPLLAHQTSEPEQPRMPASSSIRLPSPASQPPTDDIYTLTVIEVDMQSVSQAIARLRPAYARLRLELSHTACVALAAVAALGCRPLLNSAWHDDMIVTRQRVHLSIALSDGAPARLVRDAQDLNLRGLARAIGAPHSDTANADRASTFTIADQSQQVWRDPSALARGRSAALAIGAVRLSPVVLADAGVDRLAVHHTALMTLAYDPRVIDQAYADAFLRDLKRRLERFYL